MISVKKAENLIRSTKQPASIREVSINEAVGAVLQEPFKSDRDLPPFDRVMMDGIAIQFEQWERGLTSFPVEGIQPAGAPKQTLKNDNSCLEVMTGSVLPYNTDTVIRYEDVKIEERNGLKKAKIKTGPQNQRQNIHAKGTNRKEGTLLVEKGTVLSPAEIAVAATIGKSKLMVKEPPRVAVISTGDELVEVNETPLPHQIRRSNVFALSSALQEISMKSKTFHLPDEKDEITGKLKKILDEFDVLILSGGVSKGKLDYIPEILESRGVNKHFHKVRQRPAKPFWFGSSDKAVVFALPGNPVSSFMCYYRYVQPWLKEQMGIRFQKPLKAKLAEDFSFAKKLTYFLQVDVQTDDEGILQAIPVKGKGSSDFSNLCKGSGFLEMPENQSYFKTGESFPLYLYRHL